MTATTAALLLTWLAFAMGALSGAIIGWFFKDDEWLGGYNSHRRRLIRLSHIAWFGVGFVQLAWVQTAVYLQVDVWAITILIAIANLGMPLICMLTAWRRPFYWLFPLPVISVLAAVIFILPLIWNHV